MKQPSIHRLRCFSFFPYPKKAHQVQEEDEALAQLTYSIKDNKKWKPPRGPLIDDPCDFVARRCDDHDALGRDRIVVPVPRHVVSDPTPNVRTWPALRLCRALVAQGRASKVRIALTRTTEVRHSSGATSKWDRATVAEHLSSFQVSMSGLRDVSMVTLVDDVLTTGTQLMGAFRALKLAGYTGDAIGFTVSHTLQGEDDARTKNVEHEVEWLEGLDYASR